MNKALSNFLQGVGGAAIIGLFSFVIISSQRLSSLETETTNYKEDVREIKESIKRIEAYLLENK